MGKRKAHVIKIEKFPFFNDFLNSEWEIVKNEIGDFDSKNVVVFDVLWKSFSNYLSRNGYWESYCSKVLFGRLLKFYGVEKIKRGRRSQQKFFYFPLKPLKDTFSEYLINSTPESTKVSYNRIKKRFHNNYSIGYGNLEMNQDFTIPISSPVLKKVSIKVLMSESILINSEDVKSTFLNNNKVKKETVDHIQSSVVSNSICPDSTDSYIIPTINETRFSSISTNSTISPCPNISKNNLSELENSSCCVSSSGDHNYTDIGINNEDISCNISNEHHMSMVSFNKETATTSTNYKVENSNNKYLVIETTKCEFETGLQDDHIIIESPSYELPPKELFSDNHIVIHPSNCEITEMASSSGKHLIIEVKDLSNSIQSIVENSSDGLFIDVEEVSSDGSHEPSITDTLEPGQIKDVVQVFNYLPLMIKILKLFS